MVLSAAYRALFLSIAACETSCTHRWNTVSVRTRAMSICTRAINAGSGQEHSPWLESLMAHERVHPLCIGHLHHLLPTIRCSLCERSLRLLWQHAGSTGGQSWQRRQRWKQCVSSTTSLPLISLPFRGTSSAFPFFWPWPAQPASPLP